MIGTFIMKELKAIKIKKRIWNPTKLLQKSPEALDTLMTMYSFMTVE